MNKNFRMILLFLAGVLCFLVSQILFRIPLLTHFNYELTLLGLKNSVLLWLLLGFSAGVFEEGFRFLFHFLFPRGNYQEALFFGFGHGIFEALWLFVNILHSGGILSGIGVLERVIAVLFHMTLTACIWRGCVQGRAWRGLCTAIFLHGITDALIGPMNQAGLSVWTIEAFFALVSVVVFIFEWKQRKGWGQNEKNVDSIVGN